MPRSSGAAGLARWNFARNEEEGGAGRRGLRDRSSPGRSAVQLLAAQLVLDGFAAADQRRLVPLTSASAARPRVL